MDSSIIKAPTSIEQVELTTKQRFDTRADQTLRSATQKCPSCEEEHAWMTFLPMVPPAKAGEAGVGTHESACPKNGDALWLCHKLD